MRPPTYLSLAALHVPAYPGAVGGRVAEEAVPLAPPLPPLEVVGQVLVAVRLRVLELGLQPVQLLRGHRTGPDITLRVFHI